MNASSSDRATLSLPKPRRRNDINWPRDFRKFVAWLFLIRSVLDPLRISLQSIHFLSTQHSAFSAYRGVLGNWIFYAVVAILSGAAWWKVWREARWARIWGIAASLTYILVFIRPFVIPLQPVWDRHISDLLLGVIGLVVFLRPDIWADRESAS